MSDEQKDEEFLDGDDLDDSFEALNAIQRSNSSENVSYELHPQRSSQSTDDLEIEASDVLTIEELPEDSCYEEISDERPEGLIIYEYPDLDESYSHLSQAYFDNTNNLYQKTEVSYLCANSLSRNYEFEKDKFRKVADEKSENINSESGKRLAENVEVSLDAGNRKKMKEIPKENKAPAFEKRSIKSHVVRNPCTQVYEFTNESTKNALETSPDDKHYLKFPDYGSDEFADVEDNRDSSPDDNGSFSVQETEIPFDGYKEEAFPSDREKNEQKVEFANDGRMLVKNAPVSCSEIERHDDGGGISEVEKCNIGSKGASCSYSFQNSPKRLKTLLVPKIFEEGKKKNKCSMPTIAEVVESEDKMGILVGQPYDSRAKPSKLKAKVGIKKDKCNVCGVRLGLCAIRCRCGGYYCAKHRYDKEHNCTFDYKTMGAEEIRRNNPQVIAEKVRKL